MGIVARFGDRNVEVAGSLIQGDDDRNVEFHQMVDLAQRLRLAGVRFDEIVIPNEIHGFLRYASWLRADAATVEYFDRQLKR